MGDPVASRPYMPDYGIVPADEGSGLLAWSWAEDQLGRSKNLWIATVWPDGRPHVSAVWGVWLDAAVWFSCGLRARKLVNLRREPRCSVATDDSDNPVVLDGVAEVVVDRELIRAFVDATNAKYQAGMTEEFLDPASNATVRVEPITAIGIRHDDFTGSPTRWQLGSRPGGGNSATSIT